jgi:hypothetical protein
MSTMPDSTDTAMGNVSPVPGILTFIPVSSAPTPEGKVRHNAVARIKSRLKKLVLNIW